MSYGQARLIQPAGLGPTLLTRLTYTLTCEHNAQGLTSCKASVNRISSVLSSAISSEDAQEFFALARSAIASFDQLDYMNDLGRTTEQVAVLNTLQNLAYLNADEGGIRDIADWCLRQWLTVLNRDQECLEALQGAQTTSRVHN